MRVCHAKTTRSALLLPKDADVPWAAGNRDCGCGLGWKAAAASCALEAVYCVALVNCIWAAGRYRAMRQQKQNQVIVVSGESGAGKTETTKWLMVSRRRRPARLLFARVHARARA
jgi:hypothetical protein